MKKFKLININTRQEVLCDKLTIDGFDYYVSNEIIKDVRPYKGKWQIEEGTILNKFPTYLTDLSSCRLVIATTNPNIDIPKVVDEIKKLAKEYCEYWEFNRILGSGSNGLAHDSFVSGYNKSQATHPFSEEDMIDFAEFYFREEFNATMQNCKPSKEILRLWKEQQPIKVYYE